MPTILNQLRRDAADLFEAGVRAAHPGHIIQPHLHDLVNILAIAGQSKDVRHASIAVHLVAVGKAACTMAAAAQHIIQPENIKSAIVVTNTENFRPIAHFQVIAAGHPVPDEAGLKAGKQVLQNLQNLAPHDPVLLLLSGGASAMLPCPAPGLTLIDKSITTRLLMNNGANIYQLNCVRKHLSAIKGGQLAQYVAPHPLHSLILSDVPDNDLSVIASGPSYADTSTFAEAIAILHQLNIWDKVPDSVKQHLIKGRNGRIQETPKLNHPCFNTTQNTLIGDNMTCIKAITTKSKSLGYRVIHYNYPVTGNCRREAEKLVHWCIKNKKAIGSTKTAIITGGETTVTVTGTGKGGRNQEMALTFALMAKRLQLQDNWVFLSAGTDGRDGPTDASGAVVDPQTINRIPNAATWLENNDSYHALKQSHDLLQTGATGTNVADIQIALFHP